MSNQYNESPFVYKRRPTREVKVGDVGIGGNNPIRVQSMITSNTRDTNASIQQIRDLARAGSEIVRLTVPSQADADNLPNIRREMKRLGIQVPLVADIHFTPQVALKSVEWVEKVRINPGNFADKKKFEILEYTDAAYAEELERIEEVFRPLVKRAKELGVSMRIGTNHGSLSDRIMNRFGDTPLGMVESALEFIRMAEREGYRDIVVSMKASNPQVMVQAYRLLVSRFYELGMDYPLHLGVTEAGDGLDGRMKSALGIGTLLEDGLGDTIRVSLTEDAIHEIPVAKALVAKYNSLPKGGNAPIYLPETAKEFRDPFQYSRFYAKSIRLGDLEVGDGKPLRTEFVWHTVERKGTAEALLPVFQELASQNRSPDLIHFPIEEEWDLLSLAAETKSKKFPFPVSLEIAKPLFSAWQTYAEELYAFSKWCISTKELPPLESEAFEELLEFAIRYSAEKRAIEWKFFPQTLPLLAPLLGIMKRKKAKQILFSMEGGDLLAKRAFAYHLRESDYPLLFSQTATNEEELLYDAAIYVGGSLLDGLGDIIRLHLPQSLERKALHLNFDLLQATRLRLTKTEYISCPSCGRTMFDLQSTTAHIKSKTGHLKGVKIAVMGCIVNGPGEMADADFGYVGAGVGRVHLYRGKEIVKKGVPEEEAADALVDLIRENGLWVDP